ncbi:serine/arginine-rich splicing factor 11-like isoform X1 [Pseudoliparis swirei]|uniref:serine/arginine-rich splicing factor 11-like isoform X1 n=1 Tax=Pseudoliparis swirei TaxID=2059687 RepID=UPI0024BEA54F|nr:serine/arginine-rich splicing factor 11-like isoform X1 [Pseudoliparis swirei]
MNYTTKVVQVTNVSPSTTSEQMRTLFGFLGTIDELKLFPPDDSQVPVTSRVCFVKFHEPDSVGVSQHLTNTVFVDRALIVVPFAEGTIPDEAKALSLLAPANAVAGILPGGGLLPTPNPMSNQGMGGNPFGVPNMDAMAAFGFPGASMNPQAADQLLKFMTDPKLNPLAAGLNLSASLKADASNKEIEEAMKRVREAQSLISAAIEPGTDKESKKKRSRSRSRSHRRRSRSRSKHRRTTRSRSRRRSTSRPKRRSKSPRRRHTDSSRDQSRRSPSRSRDRKKEDSGRKRSKTPPKSYSTTRRSHSGDRRRKRSRTHSRSPPKKRTPSPRRHKKEKKRDKDRKSDRVREEPERSPGKKKKNKDKERERKSDGEKGDVKVTRDYDAEEQGYDSGKERRARKEADDSALSPQSVEGNGTKQANVNGDDDHHEEDMDVSD